MRRRDILAETSLGQKQAFAFVTLFSEDSLR
jgi:hypothetical protein